MLEIFGGTLPAEGGVMTVGGAYMALRFVAAVVMIALIPIAILRALRHGSESRKFVGAFAGSSMALFLFIHLTTTTPDMSDPLSSARYLVPSLVLCMILVVAVLGDVESSPLLRTLTVGLAVVLALAPISPQHSFNRIWKGGAADSRMDLVRLLEKEGLHYGYATYWNAGALSVLSDQRVLVRQIIFSEIGLPKPMRHLNSNRWYRREAWTGRSFLMLTKDEWSRVDMPRLVSLVGSPERELLWGNFRIVVFAENLAELPGWTDRLDDVEASNWPANEQTPHTTGRLAAADGRRAMLAAPGESGFLSYGPYIDLPAGRYAVSFDVRGGMDPTGNADLGRVDVALAGQSIVAMPIRAGGSSPLRLEFELAEAAQSVEFRTYVDGREEVRFLGVSMQAIVPGTRIPAH
jgi:hypothetical protein